MRLLIILCAPLALASCGDELTPAQQQAEDEALAERVREANDTAPPLVEVVPDAIEYADMESNDLLGLACTYRPGTSMGARVIAREVDAYVKIDGEMIRFAADPGSRELPAGTRTLYNGREYSLRLEIADKAIVESGETAEDVATGYEGTVRLRDRWDRVIYEGSGSVDCGA